jgi:hypothetical protein
MNLVAILIAPFVIRDLSTGLRAAIVLGAFLALAAAVTFSKRGSIAESPRRGTVGGAAEHRT